MDQWRLIDDSPANGGRNMAIDVAILDSVIAGDSPPTVRFYGWNPYCLSLGYGQRWREVDLERLEAHGYNLIRRPTGGRAVLHADEFTYSIALPPAHPLTAGSITDSYYRISAALLNGLNRVGVAARADENERVQSANPICFEVTSDYEIAFEGRKLVGSAQMRRRGGLLQHGSLPLTGDIAKICDLLHYDHEADRLVAIQSVRAHALTLEQALGGHVPDRSVIVEETVNAMEAIFNIQLVSGHLTDVEASRADELARDLYENREWTLRR